jgi:hypothetical protein
VKDTDTKRLSELVDSQTRWHFASSPQVNALPRALRQVERDFSDVLAVVPEDLDPEQVARLVLETFVQHGNLTPLTRSQLRQAAWVFFREVRLDAKLVLASDQAVSRTMVDSVVRMRGPQVMAALIHAFLLFYPTSIPTFKAWQEYLESLLFESKSRRLAKWRERQNEFKILSPWGPNRVARHLYNRHGAIAELLDDVGLVSDLSTQGLIETVMVDVYNLLENDLKYDQMSLEKFKKVLSLFSERQKLKFAHQKDLVISALLRPFVHRDPQDQMLRDAITDFLLKAVGDPRWDMDAWYSTKKALLAVMRRWMVGLTLEDFFNLIDRTADRIHWDYRRKFWLSYLREGYISDAWVVLGREAAMAALDSIERLKSYGRLVRGTIGNQSVLLMRIGDATVAERSHNGRCRIWLGPKSSHHPQLGLKEYEDTVLKRGHSKDINHHYSDLGSWQVKLSQCLRKSVGIVPPDFGKHWGDSEWTRRCQKGH